MWFTWAWGNRKSKFPRLILLLSTLLGLSDTTKLQQVFPCPASTLEVAWVVFDHKDIFCFSNFWSTSSITWKPKRNSKTWAKWTPELSTPEWDKSKRTISISICSAYKWSGSSWSFITLFCLVLNITSVKFSGDCGKKSETSGLQQPHTDFNAA